MSTHSANRSNRGLWGILGAIGIFLLSKIKWFLAIFKIGKFATLGTMFLSLGGYALFYGWKFAFALVYLIFVHEMGHLVAARWKGIKTSPAIFIPFMGAVIGIDPKKIKNAEEEFFIAYGGPLAGLFSIIPPMFLYIYTQDPYWGLVMQLGALINLFNLFPVSPLDGGRIVSVLSTKIWFVGLIILLPLIFISPDPILMLIFIFGLITWWSRFREQTKLQIMKHQVEVRKKVHSLLEPLQKMENDGNLQIRFENTVRYLKDQHHKLNTFLKNSPFYFPIFQEKKRLAVKKGNAEKEISLDIIEQLGKVSFDEETNSRGQIHRMMNSNLKQINEAANERNRMKGYYQTTIGAKIRALILYLVLAVVLALLLVYSMDIMEANKHLLRR